MDECLTCKKPVEQTPGRRKKLFCNNTCRSAHHYKLHKDETAHVSRKKYELVKNELDELKLKLAEITNPARKSQKQVQNPIEEPKNIPDENNQSEITKLEAELAGLGPGSLANQRRKYLEKMIKGYKTQHQPV